MRILEGIRAVDLGHYVAGPLAGMLLADQGADVVKVEPPGGPRLATPANATWDRGKRIVRLDLKTPDGAARARALMAGADVVIENFRPGVMERLGLGWDALHTAHPGLIYCSLPGFAPDDPRSAMPAWEGVVAAATATYRRSAHDDRGGPPVHTAEPISSAFAAFIGATMIAAALHARETTGAGRLVRVPLFAATYQALGFLGLRIEHSGAGVHEVPAWDGQYRCADGRWVHPVITQRRHMESFVRGAGIEAWAEEGLADPERLREPALNEELARRLRDLFATRTGAAWEELFAQAAAPGAMARTSAEWLRHEHGTAAGLLVDVHDPELGAMRQPGPAITIAGAPTVIRPRARLDASEPPWPDRAAPERRAQTSDAALPYAGLRVLDLCIVLAGPVCARTLAELGADVIKIDDPLREPNSYHLDVNRGKRSILLDLRTPDGRDVFWQLVATADVVVQNFRPGVVERLGIDYASVHRRKPDAVYATITAYGDDGPWAARGGYEETVQALTGMQVRFGGEDRPTLLPFAVNDYGTAMLAAYGVGLALRHRARTGEGLHVTAALARTAGTIQSLHLQDYAGKTWDEPHGQSSRGWSPFQRLYQASDGWFFLGGGADAAQRVARIPGLEQVARLDPPASEALMVSRFRELPADTWVEGLRAAGLGAHRTARVSQAMSDPIAIAHGLSVTREHDGFGPIRHNGPGQWLPGSAITPGRPTPLPGADAASVLRDIGRDGDLDALIAAGAVHPARAPR